MLEDISDGDARIGGSFRGALSMGGSQSKYIPLFSSMFVCLLYLTLRLALWSYVY